jgi:LysM repeat protein
VVAPPVITPVVTQTAVSTISTPVTPLTPPLGFGEGTEHTVMQKDSFYTLAKKYNTTPTAIANANPGIDSTKLKIGQKLKIPPPKSATPATAAGNGGSFATNVGEKLYSVKSGDNLNRIARANGVSLSALRAANNLKTDQIKVGQKLKIPAKGSGASEGNPLGAPNVGGTNTQ